MDLRIPYSKQQSSEEAYEAVKKAVTKEAIERFKVKAELNYDPKSKVILANGTGFELKMTFLDNAAELSLNLSFLLKPIKGKVLSSLEKQLKNVV